MVVVLLGALFVFIGLNALVGGNTSGPARPVSGTGGGDRAPSRSTRLLVGVAWTVLGALFLLAAFTHNVP